MRNDSEKAIIVDGHVHIYDCFELPVLFDSAYRNFSEVARQYSPGSLFTGVLMLTETRADQWFEYLRAGTTRKDRKVARATAPWKIKLLCNSCSLLAIRDTGESLLLVAGRQITSSEGLELLALATNNLFDDGKPLLKTLRDVRAQDAIPVIPWAVGKWLGHRGKILSDVIDDESDKELFLGDNGGRPIFWHNPSHFKQARSAGMHVLPGSDPLPFAAEAYRVGSFGFMMSGTITAEQPVADLKRLLRNKTTMFTAYGNLERPLHFFSNQLRLRMNCFNKTV